MDAVTEKKEAQGVPRSWEDRKREALAHLEEALPDVAMLKAADALHNAASVLAELRTNGRSVFDHFKVPANRTLWWYESLATAIRARVSEDQAAIAEEFAQVVQDLKEETARAAGER